ARAGRRARAVPQQDRARRARLRRALPRPARAAVHVDRRQRRRPGGARRHRRGPGRGPPAPAARRRRPRLAGVHRVRARRRPLRRRPDRSGGRRAARRGDRLRDRVPGAVPAAAARLAPAHGAGAARDAAPRRGGAAGTPRPRDRATHAGPPPHAPARPQERPPPGRARPRRGVLLRLAGHPQVRRGTLPRRDLLPGRGRLGPPRRRRGPAHRHRPRHRGQGRPRRRAAARAPGRGRSAPGRRSRVRLVQPRARLPGGRRAGPPSPRRDGAALKAALDSRGPMTNSAAFFDLDRTLLSGSRAYYFGVACYRAGLLPLPRLLSDAYNAIIFRLFGASDEKSEALRDRILESVAGHEAETFRRLAPAVVEELLAKVRPEAQALLDMHEEAGRDVYIISASPVEIVSELARALEITGGLGTESEIVDGVYTGRLAAPFCYGEGKAEVVRKLAAERGYDLETCYAYADSASDLP